MAYPKGIEPLTYRVETCCSIQLSYGYIILVFPRCQIGISYLDLIDFLLIQVRPKQLEQTLRLLVYGRQGED